ncbi:acetate kinase [soil metagenome]
MLNAGSSTLKASVVDADTSELLARTTVGWGSDASRAADRRSGLESALEQVLPTAERTDLAGVGHRIVHGGRRFVEPVLLSEAVLADLDEMSELAPLHNPVGVGTARAALALLPDVPHVAAFDTAFHATLAEEAFVYPLPWHWYAEHGVRRFGFHGLSVEWSVRRAAELLGRPPRELALVVAHLGSGCSVTAVLGERSVATTMGYTPLEGLMMGTRGGSVDPGVLLWALRDGGLSAEALADALDHDSGLLGVSGVSGDVRSVGAAADQGDERARLALSMFVRRAAEGIAAAASSLPQLDALVFSGGIGENAGALRAQIVVRLGVLGPEPVGDEETGVDRVLSAPGARPAALRVEAREDLVIAQAVAGVVANL